MIKRFTLLLCLMAFAVSVYAQSPQKFSYQTVVRDTDGSVMKNKTLSLRVEILSGSSQGATVFVENHELETDGQGLVQVDVGSVSDLSVVDWGAVSHFVKISVGDRVLGTSQVLSVPFAAYAQKAKTAETADYEKLKNLPDFTGWDKDASDDFDGDYHSLKNKPTLFDGNYASLKNKPELFDGDYQSLKNKPTLFDGDYNSLANKPTLFDGNYESLANKPTLFDGDYQSLKNKPTLFDGDYNSLANKPVLFDGKYASLEGAPVTISTAQAEKLGRINVTNTVNLDQLEADVATNSAKASFPGFGTEPGKVLEAGTKIWNVKDGNLYYNAGKVGVNVPEGADFGGAVMKVGGAVRYEGIPATPAPGMLFYDPSGSGAFKYYDNNSAAVEVNAGNVTYSGSLFSYQNQDIMLHHDLVVTQSIGVGNDMASGQDFGYSTLMLKENNLRIMFDDADDPNGTMPANDWQIEANSSQNGGDSYFAVMDMTSGTTPFRIMAGAPDKSFYVGASGNVGVGTDVPSHKLEVAGTMKATTFVGDGSGLTGLTGATGGVSNDGNTVIEADSDNNSVGEIAFRTKGQTRMVLTNAGKLGVGVSSPSEALEVNGKGKFDEVEVSGDLVVGGSLIMGFINEQSGAGASQNYDVSGKKVINFNASGNGAANVLTLSGFANGKTGQEVTVMNTGNGLKVLIKHEGTNGTQKIRIAGGADINLETFGSNARFVFDGTHWYCVGVKQ
ncbi:hypothetical protein FUAX_32140 [Fulvitalea axinellae]|uniref:Depolymerase 2 capsule K5-specific C-terminal domain-containing protein n=1 Tax=Fulvitalea axinellae TaxID=1182444 RepID=A0AAU9CS17_9BACT|nr:hypothetical protein FUAX_32140 [Fulvitalea axinellae]